METNDSLRTFQVSRFGRADEEHITYLVFDSTGSLLVSGGTLQNAKVWDTTSGRMLLTLPIYSRSPAFSLDGGYLAATGNVNKKIALYEVHGLIESYTVAHHRGPIKAFDLSNNGRWLACVAGRTNTINVKDPREITVWDTGSQRRLNRTQLPDEFDSGHLYADVAIQPDGKRIACLGAPFVIHLLDLNAGGGLKTFPAPWTKAIAFSPDGGHLWQAAHKESNGINEAGSVAARQLPDLVATSKWHNFANGFLGSANMKCLAVGRQWAIAGSSDSCLHLLDAKTVKQRRIMNVASAVHAAALNPNESLAAAGSDEGVVRLFSVPQGETATEVKAHVNRITSLDFSSDGTILASAGKDGALRIWRVQTELTEILTRRFDNAQIEQVKFSRDGTRLYFLIRGESALRVWRLDRLRNACKELAVGW